MKIDLESSKNFLYYPTLSKSMSMTHQGQCPRPMDDPENEDAFLSWFQLGPSAGPRFSVPISAYHFYRIHYSSHTHETLHP
jgi:hypothetical protein